MPLFKNDTKKMTNFIKFISSVKVDGFSKYANSIRSVLNINVTTAMKRPIAVDEKFILDFKEFNTLHISFASSGISIVVFFSLKKSQQHAILGWNIKSNVVKTDRINFVFKIYKVSFFLVYTSIASTFNLSKKGVY